MSLRNERRRVKDRDWLSIRLTLLTVALYYTEELLVVSAHSHDGPVFFLWAERCLAFFFTYELFARWKEAGWSASHLGSVIFWIDLIAVGPFFIGFFVPKESLHLVRTLRLLRLLKTVPFIPGVKLVGMALALAWPQVKTLLVIQFIIMMFSSSAIFECERQVEGTAFTSLFDSIWFTAVTITTVGYGDITPVTMMGRITALATFMTGLVLFAVFAGVVGSSLTEISQRERAAWKARLLKHHQGETDDDMYIEETDEAYISN